MNANEKPENPYRIELPRLTLGKHTFTFDVTGRFFAEFESPIVEEGVIFIEIELHKTATLIDLTYKIDGVVRLACDRCLQDFDYPISTRRRVIYSYDKSFEEAEDADVSYISRSLAYLDLRQDIYDFIGLEIPYSKTPPDCPGPRCPVEVLKYLKLTPEPEATPESAPETGKIDDRWDALKKFL